MKYDGILNQWKRIDCLIYGMAIHFGGQCYRPYFRLNVKINKELDIKAYYQGARKNDMFPG